MACLQSAKSIKLYRRQLSKWFKWISEKRHCSSDVRQYIVTDKVGSVQMIAINRPEKRNAINPTTAVQLFQAIKDFESDEETTAAVLYGKGGVFSSGFDLAALAGVSQPYDYIKHCDANGQGPIGPTRYFCRKPVIAAIEGYAVAGGMELALWCDLRIMEENAIMGVHCRRFGVPLVDGGTMRLPKLIGLSRALDLILTGREVKAKEALEIGLVHRICDTGSTVGRALMVAQELSKFPQECMLHDRACAYASSFDNTSSEEALLHEFKTGVEIFEKESIKGAQRFVDGVGRHGSFNLRKIQDATEEGK
ncbi:putative enoyl-CoA hydratase [Watersipora subatra]|uniref:putative enoyl-CoA hydratase n=1 Tax=Watersipora subatra TaxID=2589382 RepID=UPI00355C96F4